MIDCYCCKANGLEDDLIYKHACVFCMTCGYVIDHHMMGEELSDFRRHQIIKKRKFKIKKLFQT